MRRIAVYAAVSLAAAAVALLSVFHGGAPFVMLFLGLASVAAMAWVVVALVREGSGRASALVAAALCMLPWSLVPVSKVLSRRLVRDAQGYCDALIVVSRQARATRSAWPTSGSLAVPGRARPWLLAPGRSSRYPFTFDARDDGFQCRFPDPTAPRAFWHGEASPGGRWVWEHLMD
ncbi:MAG: hypothetical protein WCJ30_06335 [Deltaproteobacteria bacterium]